MNKAFLTLFSVICFSTVYSRTAGRDLLDIDDDVDVAEQTVEGYFVSLYGGACVPKNGGSGGTLNA